MKDLHRDLLKDREGKTGIKQEQRLSNRSLETDWETQSLHRISRKRERGREEKSQSRELSNRSL